MQPQTPAELERIRNSVERLGRLSDSLARLGPFRIGLDGVLSWFPGIGELYSAGAALFIIGQAIRARTPLHIPLICAALMGGRTAISAVPLLGPAAADLLTAHRWSARMVVRAIDRKLEAMTQAEPIRAEPRAPLRVS